MHQVLLSLLLCFVVCNAVPLSSIRINPLHRPPASAKALSGIIDYGVSQLIDVRLSGCTSAPCELTSGTSYTLQIDFSPRDMHWDMNHRAILLQETNLVELSGGPLPDSTVHPGQLYTFNYQFVATSSFKGESEFRLRVYQNYVQEIYMVIPLNIV